MNKRKYLRKLRKALGRTPESEKEELIEYYAEIIDESYERGKTTREIFATLESPEKVASDYFNANEGCMREDRPRPVREEFFSRGRDEYRERPVYSRREQRPPEKKRRSVVLTLLLIPLYVVGFVLALALGIVCVSLAICMVAFVIAGLYVLVMSFGLIPSHGTIAVTQIGAAVILFGVAVLFELAVKPLARGSGALFRTVFGKSQRDGSVVQSHWIGVLVTGAVLLVVGGCMGGFGFRALGNDWKNLAVLGEVVQKEQTVDLASGELNFMTDNLRVDVYPAQEGEGAKLVYYETEELSLEYSEEDGVTCLRCGEWGRTQYWKESFRRGLLFSAVLSTTVKAELYLPADYTGNLLLTANNGALSVSGLADGAGLGTVSLTTDNGMIAVNGLNAKTLSLDTDNGYIRIENVASDTVEFRVANGAVKMNGVQAQTVSGITHNGAIMLDKLESGNVTLETNNGAIKGTLVGSEEEYRIEARVAIGSCNLKDRLDGLKQLYVKTHNGSISLHFVQR